MNSKQFNFPMLQKSFKQLFHPFCTISFYLSVILTLPLISKETESPVSKKRSWGLTMRAKALESFDNVLSWTFDQKKYSYSLKTPLECQTLSNPSEHYCLFSHHHGYFSSEKPLIARVSSDESDISTTLYLLKKIHEEIKDEWVREIATAEILTKVLAYRDLKQGREIYIPLSDQRLMNYEVDHLFDLWEGMPAFGLVPKEKGKAAPILLFRGTDLSLSSQRSLASILSDLDPKGPGLSAFLHAQKKIHQWLKAVSRWGVKAKVMGYSLGGALATYASIYECDLINDEEFSIVFNSPGVSKKVQRKWKAVCKRHPPHLRLFITRGDLISKIGRLVGETFELSLPFHLNPISSHVTLLSAYPEFFQHIVDVRTENHSLRLLN